jgi:hypothetical protein
MKTMEKPDYILAAEIQDIIEGKPTIPTPEHIQYLHSLVNMSEDAYRIFKKDVRKGDREMTAFLLNQFNEAAK